MKSDWKDVERTKDLRSEFRSEYKYVMEVKFFRLLRSLRLLVASMEKLNF